MVFGQLLEVFARHVIDPSLDRVGRGKGPARGTALGPEPTDSASTSELLYPQKELRLGAGRRGAGRCDQLVL